MKTLLILTWLLIPIGGFFYHGGPGQKQLIVDQAGRHLTAADAHAAKAEWFEAEFGYRSALELLPQERVEDRQRVRLQLAGAKFHTGQLPDAYLELNALIDELQAGESQADSAILDGARSAQASAQYYLTWLMRLEGRPRDDWEPDIEAARQTYRYLAEKAKESGDAAALKSNQEDLESAIRLARMDLSELQGLSIPKQCQGCCSGDCKSTGKKPGRKPGNKKKDGRGASSGPPPDDGGS